MRTHSTRAKPMSISRARAERERLVRQVGGGERLQQLARARALHVDLRVARGDVGDEGVARRRGAGASRSRRGGARCRRRPPEPLVVELGDREVGLELAALVEPLRVGDVPGVAVDVVGRDAVEERARRRGPATRNFAMNDMSMRITPSRAAWCSASQYGNQFWRPHDELARRSGSTPSRRVPVGALPAADVAEVGAAAPRAGRGSATASRRARSSSAVVG